MIPLVRLKSTLKYRKEYYFQMKEKVTKGEKKESAVVERLKKMATFLVVSGFIGYVFLTLVLPNLQTVVDFWSPLFERTGLDKKFGVDPTGISGWIAAFVMTIVVLAAIAYLGTSTWGQKLIRVVGRRIPVVKNFIPKESDTKTSEETQKEVRVTKEQLRAMQPILIPHHIGPRSERSATGYEVAFIQGTLVLRVHENGHGIREEVAFRVFKPSWPVMFQGTFIIVRQTPDLLKVHREDFEQLEQCFTAGGFKEIPPLDVEPWKDEGLTPNTA